MHKRSKTGKKEEENLIHVCSCVRIIRRFIPRIGTRKLHSLLKEHFQHDGICPGRDKLFSILREARLLVKRRKRHFFTTDSKHNFYKYSNKAADLQLTRPEQLWVSDITYLRTHKGNLYLSLVTDAWSKKIMGFHVADHLKASGPIEALKMALSGRRYPNKKLMHHSDKGIQYCCDAYVKVLIENGIDISMTSKYDPYENAVAERINGTIKNEFELDEILPDIQFAKREIRKTVKVYNQLRPHLSCQMRTPEQMHASLNPCPIKLKTPNLWKAILIDNFNVN